MSDSWNDDEITKLKKLFSEGLSFGEIAARMSRPRCAVGGKLSRLGLRKADPYGLNGHHIRKSLQKTKKKVAALTALDRPDLVIQRDIPRDRVLRPKDALRLTVDNIEHDQCRWVHGDPGCDDDWSFCGLPVAASRLYCEGHCSVAYGTVDLSTPKRGEAKPVSVPEKKERVNA